MAIDAKQLAAFQGELDKLLVKYKYELIVGPVFIDKLGNKHPITVSDITAELQVKDKTDAEPSTK